MSGFQSLITPLVAQPKSQFRKNVNRKGQMLDVVKDQLQFTSILSVGATLISLLYLVIGSTALLLAPLLLLFRVVDAILQSKGFRPNPHMEGVISTKFSAQLPNADGTFSSTPAADSVAVLLIGSKNNHPLGMLAPGFKELGQYFDQMIAEIEKDPAAYGFLSASHWTQNLRSTNNELMCLMYFRNAEGIHKYAHGDLHREGWNWWNQHIAKHGHIAIWHEIFEAPKGHWETIYVNNQPALMAASRFPVKSEEGLKWVSPIVDAKRGVLRSSKGRMTRSDGKDNEKYGADPYEV